MEIATVSPQIRHLGTCHYRPIWQRMRDFTRTRTADTRDQIWLLQHHAIFTQGTSRRDTPRVPSDAAEIPVIHSDRGGRITYHAPGQLIAYLLLDLRRRALGPKALVGKIERVIIDLLAEYKVPSSRHAGAPGVYVRDAKIAALGLRITRGCCYHGLSLNVEMDLTPFAAIDPCGFADLTVTQLQEHAAVEIGEVERRLAARLAGEFGG